MSTKSQFIGTGHQIKLKIRQNIVYFLCFMLSDACWHQRCSSFSFTYDRTTQHFLFLEQITKWISRFLKISCIFIVLCHKILFFFFPAAQHTTFKESMINRLSNLINRNRSAAKISQVLCSSKNAKFWLIKVTLFWSQVCDVHFLCHD